VSFVGNTEASTQFRDKMRDRDAEGNLLVQYNAAISFVTRNLKTVQVEKEFNTQGQLEIPLEVFVEILTNAFVHRDYYINSPVRLFIFDNRIELRSPGILPDGVTEESIKHGISVPRNKLLFENAKDILPYTGIGSGIMRAMQSYDKIRFQNNIVTEEFVITILRDETLPEINEGVKIQNDTVKPGNERVKEIFERVRLENERVKKELMLIYSFIEQNPLVKIDVIEKFNKKSNATNRRYLKTLKDNGLIEYIGSDKTGGYKVIKEKG
jgi:predicted HTH transcriptional regulator